MKPQATTIDTPVGKLRAPLNPLWVRELAACETDADLFALVEERGFINPDALNEVMARGLYGRYCAWKQEVR